MNRIHRLACLLLPCLLLSTTVTLTEGGDENWFRSFPRTQVPFVERSNTTQLVEVGTIQTDGFSDLVISFGGEFKEGIPTAGVVGVLLIPDEEVFQYLLRTENKIVFPLEARYEVKGSSESAIFISEQQTAKVAFPRYRIYMYNETGSGAMVSLYIYRTR